MKYYHTYQTPISEITIAEEDGNIVMLSFGREEPEDGEDKETSLLKEASGQLKEYFSGKRKVFSLPLAPAGTIFQKQVWEALLTIPYGETRSYKDIAAQTGNDKASRAIGMANHHNPIGIIVPCHRVIGSSGKLVGYAGGMDKKEYLLELERRNI